MTTLAQHTKRQLREELRATVAPGVTAPVSTRAFTRTSRVRSPTPALQDGPQPQPGATDNPPPNPATGPVTPEFARSDLPAFELPSDREERRRRRADNAINTIEMARIQSATLRRITQSAYPPEMLDLYILNTYTRTFFLGLLMTDDAKTVLAQWLLQQATPSIKDLDGSQFLTNLANGNLDALN